jgi:DNA-binding transcriptional MerR regulator
VTITTQERTYSVGEAATQVGLTTYTLRWYEQEGLVAPVARDGGGRRRYTEHDLRFLVLLTKLRRTGMSVADMRRYGELVRAGDATVAVRLALFRAHRDNVLAQIEALQQDLEAVNYKIEIYEQKEQSV